MKMISSMMSHQEYKNYIEYVDRGYIFYTGYIFHFLCSQNYNHVL